MYYWMPAEWEHHTATWLAWPHFEGDWPGKFAPIPWVYAEIIRNLSRYERVELIVQDRAAMLSVRRLLKRANAWNHNVRFRRWPTDRVWTRDSGCSFTAGVGYYEAMYEAKTAKPELCAVKWKFNAWAKYKNYLQDDKIGWRMAKAAHALWLRAFRPLMQKSDMVLEGGSIDVNGEGTLLTTEECLLSPVQARNPQMSKANYEHMFRILLGVEQVIWLGRGIEGDDTHGHVDDISRFVGVNTIATVVEPNRKDPNHEPLRENLKRLKAARNLKGKKFEIVELPMPRPVVFEGRRLPASYANFYIANQQVLVPVFNDPNDRVALNLLQALFPTREIVPIYCGDLIWGFGAIHCMTQQQPAIEKLSRERIRKGKIPAARDHYARRDVVYPLHKH
jgi:agmatine deiminase